MAATFQRATKARARARVALIGPAGSGKTYTALIIATGLGERVAVIDTERGSASKYSNLFVFDVLELDSFHPHRYIEGIQAAEQAGYDVLVIDSASHAWTGKGGVLDIVDQATKRSATRDSFGSGWREASPLHNQLVDAMIQSRLHLVVTMRAKTEYVIERNPKTGKNEPRKIGLAPVQRDGLEYEFDVVADLNPDHDLIVGKTRCPDLDKAVIELPDGKVAQILLDWLSDGVKVEDSPGPDATTPPAGPGDATVPTKRQIERIRHFGDVKDLLSAQMDERFKQLVRGAAEQVSGERWEDFCLTEHPVEDWKVVLLEALQRFKTPGAGLAPPPVPGPTPGGRGSGAAVAAAAPGTQPPATPTASLGEQAGQSSPPADVRKGKAHQAGGETLLDEGGGS